MKTQTEHIAAGGGSCPVCGSGDMEGGAVYAEEDRASQQVRCLSCHASWLNQYTLFGFAMIETGEIGVDYPLPLTGAELMIEQERRAAEDTGFLRWTEQHMRQSDRVRKRMKDTHDLPEWVGDLAMRSGAVY